MLPRPTARAGRRRAPAARFVLPLIILAAAFAVHMIVVAAGERRERAHVSARAVRVANALERRLDAYGGVLYALRGLFSVSKGVTVADFKVSHDARDVEQRYPGVQAVGYAPLIRRADIPRRVRAVRRDVRASGLAYPRFTIHPPPRAVRVAPIVFMEPQVGNEPAFGLDLLSEPRRRDALERTLRSGLPEATAPVRLVQERGDQLGFVMLLAVEGRDGKPHGAAYAGFRMGELVDGVVPRAGREAEIELHDLGPSNRPAMPLSRGVPTYDGDATPDREAARHASAPHGSRTIVFDVMGRQWALYYAPDHSVAAANQRLLNWLPLLLGAALAALAAWLLGASLRTERRAVALAERMTGSLRDSQTDLARSNAELERFAYVASHDLREPLRTITSFLGLLSRRHRERLDDDGREFIDLAVAGAKRMDSLIAELLEYSRTGRGDTTPEPTDLNGAWGVAVRNLSAAIAETGAVVTAGPLPVVMADRGEMVQVLQNLLGNAIKYHGGDAPRIHAEAFRRGAEWEVAVCDDGAGIDPRYHERIFVLLQRLHRQDEVEGTGMGLAICKKIVEQHGGRIWVESEEGDGARFTFALPAAGPAVARLPEGAAV